MLILATNYVEMSINLSLAGQNKRQLDLNEHVRGVAFMKKLLASSFEVNNIGYSGKMRGCRIINYLTIRSCSATCSGVTRF